MAKVSKSSAGCFAFPFRIGLKSHCLASLECSRGHKSPGNVLLAQFLEQFADPVNPVRNPWGFQCQSQTMNRKKQYELNANSLHCMHPHFNAPFHPRLCPFTTHNCPDHACDGCTLLRFHLLRNFERPRGLNSPSNRAP